MLACSFLRFCFVCLFFVPFVFWDRVSLSYPDELQTCDSPTLASPVAGSRGPCLRPDIWWYSPSSLLFFILCWRLLPFALSCDLSISLTVFLLKPLLEHWSQWTWVFILSAGRKCGHQVSVLVHIVLTTSEWPLLPRKRGTSAYLSSVLLLRSRTCDVTQAYLRLSALLH